MIWEDEEVEVKKGMSLSSKILLGIIACVILIIILLVLLLINIKGTAFNIYVDGVANAQTNKTKLIAKVEDITYVNIEEFAELVKYEYHKGEYKLSTIDEDKCYVENDEETTSFYVNDNTIYKLAIDKRNEHYEEHEMDNKVLKINDQMYAPIDTISKAFNVLIQYKNSDFKIYTLEYLVKLYDTNVKNWGYTGIAEQSFENQKALLQGYLIVRKTDGLYKIINTDNTKEIVLDRYTSIEFSENTQEFFVTDVSKKVGIVNEDGTTKIYPAYDSIILLDKKTDLYIVEQTQKYGVVSGNGRTVIYPEYDSIGLSDNTISDDKYLILNELIPVCKEQKWGAFNKNGNMVFRLEYDEFGYNLKSIEINGVKEVVQPVLTIKRANGIVVRKENKYGLLNINGRELVPIEVDGIYAINGIENEDSKYFMLYNGEEINVIERLIRADKIEGTINNKEELENTTGNVIQGNNIINQGSSVVGNNTILEIEV